MLEIVLLDKYCDSTSAEDKALLKKRLANLMTPEGMDRNELYHQQLNLIDSYLADESGKATLKSALLLIKPVYLKFLHQLLVENGEALAA